MSSPFAALNTGTASIVRLNPTQDAAGGPVAAYDVVLADLPAQVDYRYERRTDNEELAWGQEVNMALREIWVEPASMSDLDFLGDTGNGFGVQFEGTHFGRVLSVERDQPLAGMAGQVLLVVKVVGVQPTA